MYNIIKIRKGVKHGLDDDNILDSCSTSSIIY